MQLMKTIGRLAIIAVAGWFAGGAAHSAEPQWLPKPLKKPLSQITVGFSNIGAGVNAYVATYTDTFNAYAKELGVRTVVLDCQADPVRQAAQIRSLTAQQVDVMIVWPINAKAVVPPVRRAHQAGVPVVITNSQMDPSGDAYVATFSGPNDYSQAQIAARLLVRALGGKGSVVMINGTPGYTAAEQRIQAFTEIVKQYPAIQILDSQPANWSREKAQSLMENYVTRFGSRIDGVFSANADMGMGALAAARAAMREGRLTKAPKFTDPTLTAAAYDAIKTGEYFASVLQSPEVDARAALKAAILIAQGQPLPKKVFIETPAVTRDTLATITRPSF